MTDKAKWLAGLKVGDPVWVRSGSGTDITLGLQRVARFTTTRIVTDSGIWFGQQDGVRQLSCGCCSVWIEKPTAAQARKAKAGKAGR